MQIELTIVAITVLVGGLLLIGITLSGRRRSAEAARGGQRAMARPSERTPAVTADAGHGDGTRGGSGGMSDREAPGAQGTMRVVWWLTVTIVLLGVGISGTFGEDSAPIFVLGAAAAVAVVIFHELQGTYRSGLLRVAELAAAVTLIGGLLALTGFASSPFAMLFALVAVAAALAYGSRAGLAAAVLASVAFGAVLYFDPQLAGYGPNDALRLSVGLVATWLLAFVAIAHATRQRRTIAAVLAVSRTDPLTGLFNRSQLFVTLEQEVSRTRRSDRGFCVLMIDLDGLKAVNDSMGHLRGDDVLRALGNVIQHSIRAVDSAYRFGGDEFVVVLPETDIVGAFVVGEKIRSGSEDLALSLATALGGGPDPFTSVSIGLVSHPEDGLTAEELMTAADRAMYQAKTLGKNQISGNPRLRPALIARRSADAAREAQDASDALSPDAPAPASPLRGATNSPREDRAVAVELGSGAAPTVPERPVPATPPTPPTPAVADEDADEGDHGHEAEDDDQPEAGEVRRQIAAASRSFDPDHQIRRAMDAFLSPIAPDAERRTPDH